MPFIRFAIFFSIFFMFPVGNTGNLRAEEEAFEALDAFLDARSGGKEEQVLGIVGFFGEPLPPQWLILFSTNLDRKILQESVVSKGKIRAERKFRRLPGQELPTIPIQRGELKIDSAQAFQIAESVAKKAKVSFESAHFQLRCRDAEREPVWMIQILSRAQVSLGVVYLSARSGDVLRVAWVQPKITSKTNPGDNLAAGETSATLSQTE